MSVDVFVQAFEGGDSRAMSATVLENTFGPHVVQREPERHFLHVIGPDGGHADVHGYRSGEPLEGLMLNHMGGSDVFELLVRFAREAGAVIMPVGGPVLLADPGTVEDLPEELRLDVRLVDTGADVLAAIIG